MKEFAGRKDYMDFTQNTFRYLINSLLLVLTDYYTFNDYTIKFIKSKKKQAIIFRHDIDRLPDNALKLAQIENELDMKGTYYFRIVSESYNLEIMKHIAKLGHEIGYHYEDVDLVSDKCRVLNVELLKGDKKKYKEILVDMAYESFCKNLEMLRKYFDIKTICMHGSPRSKYDNRIIWGKYSYKDLGIIGEPYFDINWNEFAYFTDTGRRWIGNNVSIRDKVNSKYNFNFRTTKSLIANIDKLPSKVMFTIHPERWNDSFYPWAKELVWQNIKNVVKKVLIKSNL